LSSVFTIITKTYVIPGFVLPVVIADSDPLSILSFQFTVHGLKFPVVGFNPQPVTRSQQRVTSFCGLELKIVIAGLTRNPFLQSPVSRTFVPLHLTLPDLLIS